MQHGCHLNERGRPNHNLAATGRLPRATGAGAHDTAVARCLAALVEQGGAPFPPTSLRAAQLAQRFGGLGLRSALDDSSAAPTLPVVHALAPAAAARVLHALRGGAALPSTAAAVTAQAQLRQAGYDAPDWDTQGAGPPPLNSRRPDEDSGPWPSQGWQRRACDERAFETHLSELSPASVRCCSRKQGPFAARAVNVPPTHHEVAIPSAQFRVLLLRRLRMSAHASAAGAAQMRNLTRSAITAPRAPLLEGA